ncbi:MAG: cell wall-active antibiotics response protein LiaF [Candidatus Zixiibacteriota bacterium]
MSGQKWIAGAILIVLGVLLLCRTTGLLDFTFGEFLGYLFPLFLIGVGLWLLARRRSQEKVDPTTGTAAEQYPYPSPPPAPAVHSQDFRRPESDRTSRGAAPGKSVRVSATPEQGKIGKVRYDKFIGDLYVDCSGVSLQNVEVSSFIGDVEVKLHGGQLAPGLNRMIISGFVGDVRVLVPEGMALLAQSSSFIGDIEMMGKRSSGFGNSLDAQTADYSDAPSKMYIASNHFIGDVRIYVV